jgi:hypothetical protein
MKLVAVALLFAASASAIANAQPTGFSATAGVEGCVTERASCDDSDPPRCCANGWVLEYTEGGKPGVLIEDDPTKLDEAFERRRQLDETLCRYFGSADDCATPVKGARRCYGEPTRKAAVQTIGATTFDETYAKVESASRKWVAKTGKIADVSAGARAVLGEGGPFANVGKVTDDYGKTLVEVAQRVKCVQDRLSGIATTSANGTPMWAGGKYGIDPVRELWNAGGSFGGHAEKKTADAAIADARAAAEAAMRAVDRVQEPVELDLKSGGTAKVVKRTGQGRLVFGKHGAVEDGDAVPSGKVPIAFLTPTGKGRVTIKTSGDVVTVTGRKGKHVEVLRLATRPTIVLAGAWTQHSYSGSYVEGSHQHSVQHSHAVTVFEGQIVVEWRETKESFPLPWPTDRVPIVVPHTVTCRERFAPSDLVPRRDSPWWMDDPRSEPHWVVVLDGKGVAECDGRTLDRELLGLSFGDEPSARAADAELRAALRTE